jgi:hypothetical protein
MDDLPTVVRWSTSFWALLGVLVVSLALLHVALIWVAKIGKVGWKAADYIWLAVAALGLLKLAADSRVFIANNQLTIATDRASWSLNYLRKSLDADAQQTLCRKSIRSADSPENFDAMQKEYDAACQWMKQAFSLLPNGDAPPFMSVSFTETNFPVWIDDPVILRTVNDIKRSFDQYDGTRRNYEQIRSKLGRTGGEELNLALGPLLVCFAIALRITKVTGEILIELRLEKEKKGLTSGHQLKSDGGV